MSRIYLFVLANPDLLKDRLDRRFRVSWNEMRSNGCAHFPQYLARILAAGLLIILLLLVRTYSCIMKVGTKGRLFVAILSLAGVTFAPCGIDDQAAG